MHTLDMHKAVNSQPHAADAFIVKSPNDDIFTLSSFGDLLLTVSDRQHYDKRQR